MSRGKWVVILLDQNEQFKVASTPEIPLCLSFELDTGAYTADRNGHTVSFYGTQKSKVKFTVDPFAE